MLTNLTSSMTVTVTCVPLTVMEKWAGGMCKLQNRPYFPLIRGPLQTFFAQGLALLQSFLRA